MVEISLAEADPLLKGVDDPDSSVKTAALRVLVRLPLARDAWTQIIPKMSKLLAQVEQDSAPPGAAPFDRRSALGIPQREIIEAAVLIPSSTIRKHLHHLLDTGDADARRATALALARARDVAAIAPLIADLASANATIRLQAAQHLSRLDISPQRNEVRAACSRETDDDAQFWLALALARMGETDAIEQVLRELADGRRVLKASWGDPLALTEELRMRGPFPDSARAVFARIAQEANSSIAGDLFRIGEAAETPAKPEPARGLNPEAVARARARAEKYLERPFSDLDDLLLSDVDIETLEYLDPDRATQFVTTWFRAAADSMEFVNELVRLVSRFRHPFAPDVSRLSEIYLRVQGYHALRWQIAWTISRARLNHVLADLAPNLSAADSEKRRATAQLLEEITRYAQQADPPMFGGGAPPPDVTSVPTPFIEEEASGEYLPPSMPASPISSKPKLPRIVETESEVRIDGVRIPKRGNGGGTKHGPWAGGVMPTISPPSGIDASEERGARPTRASRPSGIDASEERGARPTKASRPSGIDRSVERKTKRRRNRVVNTGLGSKEQPDQAIEKTMPLQVGKEYYFWVQIGRALKESIEDTQEEIQELPGGTRLTVALFGFRNELKITRGADVGGLKIELDGSVIVDYQPLREAAPKSRYFSERLFFPVRAPRRSGNFRMRCNIYWGQILLQSRVIYARVMARPRRITRGEKALRSVLDYTLARTLNPAHLTRLEEHRLSVMLNRNGDGTHSFHFYGQQEFKKDDVRFREGELQGMITQARGTLRMASWGNPDEWQEGNTYRYKDGQRNLARLKEDLSNLAIWGFRFYDTICEHLGEDAASVLEKLMSAPGSIQIAMKESPSYVLPAAMIYDHPLDTFAPRYSICPTFEDAFKRSLPLEQTICFQGNCPSREKLTVVCPSGFWGYRHRIGFPLSIQNAPDAPPEIAIGQELRMAVSVATDLELLPTHMQALQRLRAGLGWYYADTRDEVFDILKRSAPHIVYFYCHGGLVRDVPYLQVGAQGNKEWIDRTILRTYKIVWDAPRPLVFINGCHTTAVEPHQALGFISPLVAYSKSAGVIGTEITVFENVATAFAEECFRRFFAGESIGAAIRGARLKLLSDGNPLGLVYIPFIMAGVRLKTG